MFPMWGLCVPVVHGEGSEVDAGVVTGVNAGVYGCIHGRVWEGVSTGVEPGARLH